MTSYVKRTEKDVLCMGQRLLEDIRLYKETTVLKQLLKATELYRVPMFANAWGLFTKEDPSTEQIMRHYWDCYACAYDDPAHRYASSARAIKQLIRNLQETDKEMFLSIEDLNLITMKIEY